MGLQVLTSVEVRITAQAQEIIVYPRFYELDEAHARAAWDSVVSHAARRGYYLVQVVEPDIDPSWCCEVDAQGVEYHYLVPAVLPAVVSKR